MVGENFKSVEERKEEPKTKEGWLTILTKEGFTIPEGSEFQELLEKVMALRDITIPTDHPQHAELCSDIDTIKGADPEWFESISRTALWQIMMGGTPRRIDLNDEKGPRSLGYEMPILRVYVKHFYNSFITLSRKDTDEEKI